MSDPIDDAKARRVLQHDRDHHSLRWAGAMVALVGGITLAVAGPAFADEPHPSTGVLVLGQELFARQWKPNDPRCHGGDGLGPVYNAKSCLDCHFLGGAGGAGSNSRNVTLLHYNPGMGPPPSDLARLLHPDFRETRSLVFHHHDVKQRRYDHWRRTVIEKVREFSQGFPPNPLDKAVAFTRRNTPPLFGSGAIDAIPDDVLIAAAAARRDARFPEIHGRVNRVKDGRVGHFGWKAQVISFQDFVLTACANELGLESPGHPQARSPLRFDAGATAPDLTAEECNALVAYVRSLPPPAPAVPAETQASDAAWDGCFLFESIGCAACHVPKLGPIVGIYGDLLLHNMGKSLSDVGNYYATDLDSTQPPNGNEWRTPPLWGLRQSAPYLHDGRAATWQEAVAAHGGEAKATAERFAQLAEVDREKIGLFLASLGPPPAPRAARPRPTVATSGPIDPARRAAARLAIARNLEKSGKTRAALDDYRAIAREAPETEAGRAADGRIRALASGEPSGGRTRSPSMLFTAPSPPPEAGRAGDLSRRADR